MKVLDLFAGTGVGVACQRLGLEEYGVEIMPEAVASRDAAGFTTVYRDAWDADNAEGLDFDILWASPPCQTFSMAGSGSGRVALDQVLAAIDACAWVNIDDLKALGASVGDDRTALVLVPLHYIYRFRPTFVALEQVPTVLPVWEAYAEVLEELGYSVWTGFLHSEQYGVPQTRKRAYLIARNDRVKAAPPPATHSRYYARTPDKFDEGVQPWVSMADALGWVEPYPEFVVTGGATTERYSPRSTSSPSPVITAAGNTYAGSGSRFTREGERKTKSPGWVEIGCRARALLQSYPADFPFQGSKTQQSLQIGNAVPPLVAEKVLRVFVEGGA